MDNRRKINSIYFNPDKEGADSAACEIIANLGKNRACSHREIYLAGLFLHQISSKATKLIAENLEVDVDINDLIRTLNAARILIDNPTINSQQNRINSIAAIDPDKPTEPIGLDENGDAITTHQTSVNVKSKRTGPRRTSNI